MALKKTIQLSNGITVQDAYIKIDTIIGDKNSLNLVVNAYCDVAYSDNHDNKIHSSISYNFIPSSDENSARWDKQAYLYLKTLPEYVDATDC